MARTTKKQEAADLIERVNDLLEAGSFLEAYAARPTVETAIQACRPQDRAALTKDLEHAYETHPEPKEPEAPTELAIRSWHDVEGVDAVVNDGVKQVRKAVNAGLKTADMARQIAETLLDARLKMRTVDDLPDIVADRKYTKDIARDLFLEARKGVTEEDVHRWATHKSLAKAVRNRMSDVVVEYLRGLDDNPDAFPAMDRARKEFPKLSATEAVYALYEKAGTTLPRKGRTELARDDARRKAELLRQLEAGTYQEEDEEQDGEELAKDIAALERVERGFLIATERAASLTPEARGQLKARLNEMITKLAAAAAGL
ncbi:hypothetical protein [Streptomyces viridochromogenes]|uniref:hypothetical protein n=1 Tax=Streptomyces viridochromogenes TaxID=1938 RepID=UPI000B2826FD|nr:hypothetical protein [Streptomyces viridochromogenes]